MILYRGQCETVLPGPGHFVLLDEENGTPFPATSLIGDDLDFFVHPVFQNTLDVGKIVFRHLDDRLADVARFSVPVSNKVVAFVLHPFIEITVMLYPVFTKNHLRGLGRQQLADRQEAKDT